jgi:hypothetical protein
MTTRATLSAALALGLITVALASAQSPPPKAGCTAAEHRQFDFWVGTWDVTANGKRAGENRIEKILDGCALLESWTGAGGNRGNSLNYYDAARGQWHQTWIDATGGALELDGSFAEGKMTLIGTHPPRGAQPGSRDRIVWTALPTGQVRQLWETSADEGKTWTVAFDGLYTRR